MLLPRSISIKRYAYELGSWMLGIGVKSDGFRGSSLVIPVFPSLLTCDIIFSEGISSLLITITNGKIPASISISGSWRFANFALDREVG